MVLMDSPVAFASSEVVSSRSVTRATYLLKPALAVIMAEVALSAVMAEMAESHISSGHTVWWNGTTWCWHAWFNGYNGTGSQEWALDAELRAMEWISMQGREPLAKVLDDVHRLRKELGWTGEV